MFWLQTKVLGLAVERKAPAVAVDFAEMVVSVLLVLLADELFMVLMALL